MKIKDKLKKNLIFMKIYKIIINIKRNIMYFLPKKMMHKYLYKKQLRKSLNLKEPKDLNDKIQYMILYKYGKKETELADKLLVRKYVKEKGLEEILPNLYKIYNNAKDIDINELPDKFVLKANNGSGNICICDNKKNFDIALAKKKLNEALKTDFAKVNLEYHYHGIKPYIICEEYLDEGTGKSPLDYKFFCFNGKAECILVCSNRDKRLKLDYYDLNWNYLDYSKKEYRSNTFIEKPQKLKEMVKIAEKLSKGITFVRVDLYNINGKIYFGELTFTPSAGMMKRNTQESLNYLGNLIDLGI